MTDGIGVIGLGNMGRGLARNLRSDAAPLAVWDVDAAARAPFSDDDRFAVVPPSEMAAHAARIFFVVPSSREIEACLDDGLLAAARDGTVFFDMTTSDPGATRALAARAEARGLAYLDVGMSGGAQGAAAGTLTLMIGGDEATFAAARPLLDKIAANLHYMGPSGAGHTAKLLQNMVTHTVFLATCEAGRLGERAGIDLADLIALFNVSNARSYISERRFPDHILSRTWDGGSRVFNLHKDLGLAVALARAAGLPAAYGETTLGLLNAAIDRGMADEDFTRLYEAFEGLRG